MRYRAFAQVVLTLVIVTFGFYRLSPKISDATTLATTVGSYGGNCGCNNSDTSTNCSQDPNSQTTCQVEIQLNCTANIPNVTQQCSPLTACSGFGFDGCLQVASKWCGNNN
jgi:hypothetical protein